MARFRAERLVSEHFILSLVFGRGGLAPLSYLGAVIGDREGSVNKNFEIFSKIGKMQNYRVYEVCRVFNELAFCFTKTVFLLNWLPESRPVEAWSDDKHGNYCGTCGTGPRARPEGGLAPQPGGSGI
jgi:hypothetical protein